MRRGCGRHLEAVQLLDLERIKPSLEAYVELVFLRGSHSLPASELVLPNAAKVHVL
jgi:hypothetical protein